MEQERLSKGISFDQFVVTQCKFLLISFIMVEKYCRSSTESIDQMIFELFDLSGNGFISQRDLAQMLLTLPEKAIITTIPDKQ